MKLSKFWAVFIGFRCFYRCCESELGSWCGQESGSFRGFRRPAQCEPDVWSVLDMSPTFGLCSCMYRTCTVYAFVVFMAQVRSVRRLLDIDTNSFVSLLARIEWPLRDCMQHLSIFTNKCLDARSSFLSIQWMGFGAFSMWIHPLDVLHSSTDARCGSCGKLSKMVCGKLDFGADHHWQFGEQRPLQQLCIGRQRLMVMLKR